jgi:short-subunit dehydrogenase
VAQERRKPVVVITGASSGIGRATATLLARRGARLVLASRRQETLDDVAMECRALGGEALVVPTDVCDESAVEQLAERAIEQYGGFDVWINNAGVVMYAPFEEAPSDAFKQVLDTNLMGHVYGSKVAVRYFRQRGHGTLIQVASALGLFAAPYLSAYVASKFAIVGLSSSLRQELRKLPDVHVCTVLPAAIDTPIYQQAANYTGKAVKPMSPVVSVERVARAIVSCIDRPRRHVVVGIAGWLGTLGYRIAPGLVEYIVGLRATRDHFQSRSEQPNAGNVFEAGARASSAGGWGRFNRAGSPPPQR